MNKEMEKDVILADLFKAMKLPQAYDCLLRQQRSLSAAPMDFESRLIQILQAQLEADEQKRIRRLLKKSRLYDAMPDVSRITYEPERNLKKAVVDKLCEGRWLNNEEHTWIAITGASGTGKTFLAKAILKKLIEQGIGGQFYEMQEFLETLALERESQHLNRFIKSLEKLPVLVLDDFQLGQCEDRTRRDFLAFLRTRYERSALIITSQYPVESWYDYIGVNEPAVTEGIADRLMNGCFRIDLKGPSLRERRKNSIS